MQYILYVPHYLYYVVYVSFLLAEVPLYAPQICGAPGDAKCSEAECGGALCKDAWGGRKCGGPDCKGSLPVSQNASKTAEKTADTLLDLLHKLRDSTTKVRTPRPMRGISLS